jgi:membrane-associated phospholipid phosphatase
VDWSGYSFASGHTIAATLLYGQLLLFLLPLLKNAPFARPLHFQRGIACVCGGIQPHCVGRAFSD